MGRNSISKVGFVLFRFWAAVVEAEYIKYQDSKQPLGVRIKGLIGRATPEEKIGHLAQIDRRVASADVMRKYFIGSILSGGGSVPAPKASAETWANAVNEFQKGAVSSSLGIPMLYGIDAVHGNNNVLQGNYFPPQCWAWSYQGSSTCQVSRRLGLQQLLKLELQEFLMFLHRIMRSAGIHDGFIVMKAIVIILFKP